MSAANAQNKPVSPRKLPQFKAGGRGENTRLKLDEIFHAIASPVMSLKINNSDRSQLTSLGASSLWR